MLWDRLRRRLEALGLADLSAYMERLENEAAGPAEWRRLEGEVTVGETYFLRYAEQFAALRETILPQLIEARRPSRRLRIWSAGCSTGAEPYSVAILLHELLGGRLSDWRISILGTDINEAALDRAAEGLFGPWALRALSPEQKQAWFTQEGRHHRLRRPFRSLVRFRRSNLLDLLGQQAPLDLNEFDLILCRNVLIYFHPDVVEQLVDVLGARLNPDGWLLLGHAEPNLAFERTLRAETVAGATAYRRREAPLTPAPVEPWSPPAFSDDPTPAPSPRRKASPATPAAGPAIAPPPPITMNAAGSLETAASQVRALADGGDLSQAAEACRAALSVWPEAAILHYYQGLISRARGQTTTAAEALRRAVYLQPDFLMAQYHLALARLEQGEADASRRSLAALARQAAQLSPTTRLCEGEGMTAADLRELARLQLESGG